jgi:hypothetical protein
MRFSLLVLGLTISGCGDDGGGGTADAPKFFMDAKVFMDAPSSLTGLGQRCVLPMDCPTSAPDCISVQLSSGASNKYCTPRCVEGGTFMVNNMGTIGNVTPAPDHSKCTAAYSGGGIGVTLACALLTSWTPMDSPLKNGETYTNVTMGCLIRCGTNNECPVGTSCTSSSCFPN